MSAQGAFQELPADLRVTLAGFTVIGALLACADPDKWASLARPPAADLGALILALTDRLETGLAAIGFEAPHGP